MNTLPSARRLVWIILALAACPARSQEFPDNVVIVLDASGSMKERLSGSGMNKMDAAKSALKTVLQRVPPSTHIGLLVFSAKNLKNDWAYPLGPRDDAVLMSAIESIEASSGTPLGAYLKKGADRLLQERAKQFGYGSYRLLVVTDGEAQDQDLVDRYTPDVMSRGITLDVIGVGMRQEHTLATRVHSYRRANDPESLSRAVREAFAEIASTATDTTRAEVFEMLAPLPSSVAASMIQALSTSGNQPIGTKPAVAPVSRAQPSPSASQPVPAPQASQQLPPPSVKGSTRGRLPFWPIVVGVVIVTMLVRRLGKGARR